ncbi:GNAT family N-acetyltransferase [Evansella halocellulosilytica]|uniref:GNAT family N-acetyltransferase n=1 Tax=Evansella halocellulosilytica TaxID=2011013 RepID=UPI000BB8C2DA|nr:GNAT family N-acetyltransferase [Evansella halocellulosilytica]
MTVKSVDEVNVVQYHSELASAVAHMWNESREGWGGHSNIKTAEDVQMEEENSTNLFTFIAMIGEEAVGYCGLSEYRDDHGALYIPLLNVRTDFHGKKIGKKLVLTALEETMKRKWPRLDLYTWPGNIKAVPLYKKCGFFWEKRDDSVHLMNFIPSVLTVPAFQPLFAQLDWYIDSQREIRVEPDGEKKNGFDYYDYHWENEHQCLKVRFERTGRGICAAETNDYAIQLEVDQHKNIFGKSYPVRLKVTNKTPDQLNVHVEGQKNSIIDTDFNDKRMVTGDEILEGSFYIHPTDVKQDSKKTHPSVEVNVSLNGEVIPLKLGVLPKEPVSIQCYLAGNMSFEQASETAYMSFENQFDTAANVLFKLPDDESVHFHNEIVEMALSAGEKKTVPIKAEILSAAFYSEVVTIHVQAEKGRSITFNQQISFPFNTLGSSIYGECPEYYHLFNGVAHAALKKENNHLLFERGRQNESDYIFLYPKLGKPFSEEFSIKKPESIYFYERGATIGMKLSYLSRDFDDVMLNRIVELTSEGLMSQHYEIENRGDQTVESISLNTPFSFSLANTYLPYGGEILFNQGTYYHEVDAWDDKKLTENWLFTKDDDHCVSLVWDERQKLHFHTWHRMYFEETWDKVECGKTVATSSVHFGINLFSNTKEVKEFALKKPVVQVQLPQSSFVFRPKDGNPFIEDETILTFSQNVLQQSETNLQITGDQNERIGQFQKPDSESWESWETVVKMDPHSNARVRHFQLSGRLSSQTIHEDVLLYPVQGDDVKKDIVVEDDHEVFILDNGYLSVKGAPSFYPGFYSLKANGTEWLDSSFPTPSSRSWWNPWVGGVNYSLNQLLQRKILESHSTCQFVSLDDSFSGRWEGLKMSTEIKDHSLYDGLTFHQYVATRPGTPVLATFTEFEQNTGFDFHGTKQTSMFNLCTGDEQGHIRVYADGDETNSFVHHRHETELYGLSYAVFEQNGRNEKLHFIPNNDLNDLEVYMNRDVVSIFMEQPLHVKNKATHMIAPHFFLFSDQLHSLDVMNPLRAIRFFHHQRGAKNENY